VCMCVCARACVRLMVAHHKGVALSQAQAEWVLGLVKAAASHAQRDCRRAADAFDLGEVSKLQGVSGVTVADTSLIYAVLFRRDYKCMAGDKKMFNACAHAWVARFRRRSACGYAKRALHYP
jgi:hypothetical protein